MTELSIESLEFIYNFLINQDAIGALGKCDDYMNDEGFCIACTAMQDLQEIIHERKCSDSTDMC